MLRELILMLVILVLGLTISLTTFAQSLEETAHSAKAVQFSPAANGLVRKNGWADYQIEYRVSGVLRSGTQMSCGFQDEWLEAEDLLGVIQMGAFKQNKILSWQSEAVFRFTETGAIREIQDKPFRKLTHSRECLEMGRNSDGDPDCVSYGKIETTHVSVYLPIAGLRSDRGQRYLSCSKHSEGDAPNLNVSYAEFVELIGDHVHLVH